MSPSPDATGILHTKEKKMLLSTAAHHPAVITWPVWLAAAAALIVGFALIWLRFGRR
jgi:hypothetical protein